MNKNVVLIILFGSIFGEEKNVCKTFKDYDHKRNNSNCYVNHAADNLVPQVIMKYGYPFEKHNVETKDGYILTMHRIPNNKRSSQRKTKLSPVFILHGMICDSSSFVSIGKNSLAFLLADLGYDAWLGNYRGNIYSNQHKTLTTDDAAYWDFTMDDLAMVDLSLCLKYIVNVTSTIGKIIYIGHSLGAMVPMMYASEQVKEAKSLIKSMYLMATADSVIHSKSAGMVLTRNLGLNHVLSQVLGLKNPLTSLGIFIPEPIKQTCLISSVNMRTCFEFSMTLVGSLTSIKPDVFPPLLSGIGAGTPFKVIQQMGTFLSRTLSKFDYGILGNNLEYGQDSPPEYRIENVDIPTYICAAKNDWLLNIQDSKHLYNRLPSSAQKGFFKVPSDNFNHADYLYGSTVKKLVYEPMIKLINKFP